MFNDGENVRAQPAAVDLEKPPMIPWRECFVWQGLPFQLIVLFGCWMYMVGLHWSNDGLFFQGDAPRHAMNGIFWGDLLREGLSDPIGYTKSYYARYPAITPTRYPPLFYFLEAAAFELLGPSSYVAKGLVQAFGLAMGVYLLVAMRRWISPGSGIFAGLLFLMPGMVTWSNAVMLNVPAATFSMIALYYVRCGIESQNEALTSKCFILAEVLLILSLATHPTVGYAVLIMLAWVIIRGKLYAFKQLRLMLVTIFFFVLLATLFSCMLIYGSEQLSQASILPSRLSSMKRWWFYAAAMPGLVAWWGLIGGLLSAVLAWTCPRLRLEVKLLGIAFLVGYLILTPVWALDARYTLLACPAVAYTLGLGFTRIDALMVDHARRLQTPSISLMGFFGLSLGYIVSDNQTFLRNTAAIESVVEYVESIAPEEAVLYDGRFDGVFIYYMRARDPEFSRQVVLARKLIAPDIDSDQLRKKLLETGCRWLVLEKTTNERPRSYEKALQRLVQRGGFELVKTFELLPRSIERLEVYRLTSVARQQDASGSGSVEIQVQGDLLSPLQRNLKGSGLNAFPP
jgi:hypothetical protein